MNNFVVHFEPLGLEFPENILGVVENTANLAINYCKVKYHTETSLIVTNNKGISKYNRKFRNVNGPTDVLSFPLLDFDAPVKFCPKNGDFDNGVLLLGDMVLSYEKALEQAEEYGHSIEREMAFLTVHGILHLLGYDHILEEDEKLMFRKQKEILKKAGFER